MTRERWHDLI